MESYTPKSFEDDKKPDQTGDAEVSKKKKKKASKILGVIEKSEKQSRKKTPLSIEKSDATAGENRETKESGKEQQTAKEPDSTETDIQSDTDQPEAIPDEAFQGELIIDHTGEELILPDVAEQTDDENLEQISADKEQREQAASNLEKTDTPESPVPVPPPFWHEVPLWHQRAFGNERASQQAASRESLLHTLPLDMEQSVNQEQPPAPIITSEKEDSISRQEATRRSYRAEKRGLSRGVASGALVGWWVGRRSGRRQVERAAQPRFQKQEQDVQQLRSEVRQLEDTIEKRTTALGRTQERLQALIDRTRNSYRQERLQPSRPEAPAWVRQPAIAEEPLISKKPEIKKSLLEKPSAHSEDQPITEQAYQAPAGHRYETSAWHRIEVDDKTGRLVEKPAHEYGEAFHQEQQQEKLVASAAKAQTAAQVGMTLLAADNIAGQMPLQPQATLPVEPKQPSQLQTMLQDTEYIRHQLVSNATNPSIWLTALVIVALLLLSGIL